MILFEIDKKTDIFYWFCFCVSTLGFEPRTPTMSR